MRESFESVITNPFFGLVTAIVGFIAGCIFTIYRDRRKEFNVAADKLAERIHREHPGDIALVEFDDFGRYLGLFKRRRYIAALTKYKESTERDLEITGNIDLRARREPVMKNPEAATVHLRELAAFTKRR